MEKIFNTHLVGLHRQRAQNQALRKIGSDSGFLHIEAAKIIGERLASINRQFSSPVYLFNGPYTKTAIDTLCESPIPLEKPILPISANWQAKGGNPEFIFEDESADLVISIFDLHWSNDPGAQFSCINRMLKPDGLFLCVLPIKGMLEELRQSILSAEAAISQSAGLRIDPFMELQQIGDLLTQADFRLSVCDREEFNIRYQNFQRLADDLRANGASRAGNIRLNNISRKLYDEIVLQYQNKWAGKNGALPASVKLGFFSGWKKHESQQNPLKPGSATNKLANFL